MHVLHVAAALLLGLGLAAQAPKRDARALAEALGGPKAEAVAWAAHDGRVVADKQVTAALQRALTVWRDDHSLDGRLVCAHVLDALVEHKARLPGNELLGLLDEDRFGVGTAAFVLLAREPKLNEAELLELFRQAPPPAGGVRDERHLRFRAIGNLLCAQRTPGFAKLVWDRVGPDLLVEVDSPRTFTSVVFRKRGGGRNGDPDGFPPTPRWRLGGAPDPTRGFLANQAQPQGLTLLADGPRPVWYGRSEPAAADDEIVFASVEPDGLAWLHDLGQPGLPMPWHKVQVVFRQPADYLAAVATARATLHTYREALRAALVAQKALSAEEAAALPTAVGVRIVDQRTDKSQPLPEIPER